MKGRDVAALLRSIVAGAVVVGAVPGTTGCEPLHWCINGQYGAPYYDTTVREVPEHLRAAVADSSAKLAPKLCRELCENDGDICQLASMGAAVDTKNGYVVCFAYRKNGCPSGWGSGRLPEGLAIDPRPATTLGETFARAAALEAASVVSFRRLSLDLERLGAPRSLVRRAQRAARDERRHAAIAGQLARRFGAERVRARLSPTPLRSLRELAMENAIEGCVGETLGALLLFARARVCTDDDVRAKLLAITRDEIAHAALAWDLRSYFRAHLDASGRSDESRALAEACRSATGVPIDPLFPFDPRPLVEALERRLWEPAMRPRARRGR